MRKSSTYKILAAVLAAGSLGLYAAAPAAALLLTFTATDIVSPLPAVQ